MLTSKLFRGNAQLQDCERQDAAHITLGTHGEHVSKIHTALLILDGVSVAVAELRSKTYGQSTAAAVLRYKTRRNIINHTYQSTADNIVGKMTIAAMDAEVSLDVTNGYVP